MILCNGCAAFVKRSGIVQHCRLSQNPACRTFLQNHIRTTDENEEDLEAYMHDNDDLEIGMEITFSPKLLLMRVSRCCKHGLRCRLS